MKLVHRLPVAGIDASLLEHLRAALPQRLPVRSDILPLRLDPVPCCHRERQQFHSSEILEGIGCLVRPGDWRFLAVAAVDLCIPILQYVFGEAQMGGACAVASTYRMRQEFCGLDSDDSRLRERLLKECLQELGHTLNLRHCLDYQCAMAPAHSVECIDPRQDRLCAAWPLPTGIERRPALDGDRSHHKPAIP